MLYFQKLQTWLLITKKELEEIDVHKMYRVYDKWPELAENGYNSNLKQLELKTTHIVFSGMGGSGAIGDIFSSILSKTDVHVDVVKGYHLPKTAGRNSLVVITSISGNTDETMSVLEQALTSNCNIIAFSSGGKMKEFCEKKSIEFRQIQMEHSPRASFIGFLYYIISI